VPKPFRDALPWLQSIKPKDDAPYELMTPGRARLLAKNPIEAARAAGDELAATWLTSAIIFGAWETDSRITLPPLTVEWIFGKDAPAAANVLVWANEHAVEFWSDAEWESATARGRSAGVRYLPAG